ncbi:thiolase family protein [Novosphingobium sp. P6W]|uniref:thiolase family protein n=1 Tax=Novosphingobium sp. P6W TaxID=1609758 RepID=UPI0005C2CA56|nr:thiolase family protein [Novosphingobium sp. P6W]AXB79868.1 thiolase family protein [Novosphingobium sp. P6W]KIS29427.1 acetyl-CoA acetyltransferase [Novosphingobium sp. P6W]
MSTARDPLGYNDVAVVCPVTVPYQRASERQAHWFFGQALRALVEASGVRKEDIDGLACSSFTLGADTTIALTEHFDMSPRWIEWLPTGGASGVMALRRAARAIQCGDASIVACIAADTANSQTFAKLVSNFSRFSDEAILPQGKAGPNGVFALITDNYMRRFGAVREDFGRIAVAQRANAADNSNALLGDKPLDMESYLSAPPIVTPIHKFDCVMPCAGAEAFLVMSTERARELGLRQARVMGAIERHNAYFADPVAIRGGWAVDADALWAQAGITPADVDCLQTYDDYPVICAMQIEDLGFCGKGEAPAFLRARDLSVTGDFPHNTCGGQLSCGQAGAAGGFLPVVEALRQVTGQPLGAQVPGARIALASGYGMVTYDRCLATGALLLESVQ